MLTGTPSEKTRRRAARRGREDEATRIGWRMAGLGIETVSYVLGGVAIGWGLKNLVVQWGWPESDGWIIGGAAFGMASGFSQLIRGGLRLNRELEAATRRSRDAADAAPEGDGPSRTEDKEGEA